MYFWSGRQLMYCLKIALKSISVRQVFLIWYLIHCLFIYLLLLRNAAMAEIVKYFSIGGKVSVHLKKIFIILYFHFPFSLSCF